MGGCIGGGTRPGSQGQASRPPSPIEHGPLPLDLGDGSPTPGISQSPALRRRFAWTGSPSRDRSRRRLSEAQRALGGLHHRAGTLVDLPGSEPLLLRSSGTSECLPSPSAHGRMPTPANSRTRRETADPAGLPPAHAVSLRGTSSGRSLPSSDDPSLADRKQGGEAAILEPDPPHARRSKRQHRGPLLTRAPVACGPTTRRRSRLPKNLAALGLEPRILESKSPRHRRSHGLRAKGSSLFGSATTNTPRILDYLPAAKPPPHHRKTCGLVTTKPPYPGPISAQREVIQQPHKQTTFAAGEPNRP